MIDLLATLEPGHGLAGGYQIVPPQPPVDLLWRTLVVLADTTDATDGESAEADSDVAPLLSRRVVGAYGATRSDCVPRGVGEAVERFALIPTPAGPPTAVDATAATLTGSRQVLDFAAPGVALGHPAAAEQQLRWYPGRRLSDAAEIWLPAALVDDPAEPATAGWFDSGPSGAAAGPDLERATRSALLEMIERDAFMVAWERELQLSLIDPELLTGPGTGKGTGKPPVDRGACSKLIALRSKLDAIGAQLVLAALPTGIASVRGVVAIVLDRGQSGPLAIVGCKVSDDIVVSAVGAIQEALQIRSTMINGWQRLTSVAAPTTVVTDEDRLRWLAGRDGVAAVTTWAAGFRPAQSAALDIEAPDTDRPPSRPVSPDSRSESPVGLPGLIAAVAADGGDPILVDLTARLPESLQQMGWAAVKVIPVGYQHLRIDERLQHSWNGERLSSAEARTGIPAGAPWPRPRRPANDSGHRPHPLP